MSNNLKPIQSSDEARERGRKGGYKSGQVRRDKRKLKNVLEILLSMEATEDMKEKALNIMPEMEQLDDITFKDLTIISLIGQAIKGNIKAFEVMRDTLGEKPKEKVEVTDKTERSSKIDSLIESINKKKEIKLKDNANK